MKINKVFSICVAGLVLFVVLSGSLFAAEVKQLRIAYMPQWTMDMQVKYLKKWGIDHGIEILGTPMAYTVYVEKTMANFQLEEGEYDIVWNNDDWGHLFDDFMISVDDLPVLKVIDPVYYAGIHDYLGYNTAVPFSLGLHVFFYRTDLIPEWPDTWEEAREACIQLKEQGVMEYPWVAGMPYPNVYFTFLQTLWSNEASLFYPPNERDESKLAPAGWPMMLTSEKGLAAIEFWWDNIHKYKISPPGMPNYSRAEAQAVFLAGEGAISYEDTNMWGRYTDPKASKVWDRVAMGRELRGPAAKHWIAWKAAWSWSIPKNISPERQELAKQAIEWLVTNKELGKEFWYTDGGLSPNLLIQYELKNEDPLYREVADMTFDAANYILPAYYFPEWVQVNQTFSDYCVQAMMGKREDIPGIMAEAEKAIQKILMGG